MENNVEIPIKGFTHGGKFHSDDVFSTAFLKILNPEFEVVRGFEVPENFDGIVYDIGRGEFDHHQAEKEYRENGCPYAAFGLLWRVFGKYIFEAEDAEKFDYEFIQPLDESDNTGCDNMLAKIIAEFNPGWDSDEKPDECFGRAVDMAKTILENHFESVRGVLRGQKLVYEAMEKCDGEILVLDIFAPWKRCVLGSSYKFVIYKSKRGGYSIQGVPKGNEDNALVCDFPKEWWGATREELVEKTGIESFRFCHPNGFLAAADDFSDAKKIAKFALGK